MVVTTHRTVCPFPPPTAQLRKIYLTSVSPPNCFQGGCGKSSSWGDVGVMAVRKFGGYGQKLVVLARTCQNSSPAQPSCLCHSTPHSGENHRRRHQQIKRRNCQQRKQRNQHGQKPETELVPRYHHHHHHQGVHRMCSAIT